MNPGDTLLWGFAASIVLTTVLNASRALGLTRMDIPFLLGTMFTESRNRAKGIGFLLHLLMGVVFYLQQKMTPKPPTTTPAWLEL